MATATLSSHVDSTLLLCVRGRKRGCRVQYWTTISLLLLLLLLLLCNLTVLFIMLPLRVTESKEKKMQEDTVVNKEKKYEEGKKSRKSWTRESVCCVWNGVVRLTRGFFQTNFRLVLMKNASISVGWFNFLPPSLPPYGISSWYQDILYIVYTDMYIHILYEQYHKGKVLNLSHRNTLARSRPVDSIESSGHVQAPRAVIVAQRRHHSIVHPRRVSPPGGVKAHAPAWFP